MNVKLNIQEIESIFIRFIKILIRESNERITINEIKKHKFYLKGKDIFNSRHKDINLYKNIELKQSINYNRN